MFSWYAFIFNILIFLSSGCGTFIGNPDKIDEGDPSSKESVNENFDAPDTSTKETPMGSDPYMESEGDYFNEIEVIDPWYDISNIRYYRKDIKAIKTQENPVYNLPIRRNEESIEKVRESLLNNQMPSKDGLFAEDFIDYFSSVKKEQSSSEIFTMTHDLVPALWDANTYVLAVRLYGGEKTRDQAGISSIKVQVRFSEDYVTEYELGGYDSSHGFVLETLEAETEWSIPLKKTWAFLIKIPKRIHDEKIFDLIIDYSVGEPIDKKVRQLISGNERLVESQIADKSAELANASLAYIYYLRGWGGVNVGKIVSLKEVISYLESTSVEESEEDDSGERIRELLDLVKKTNDIP